MSRPGGRRGPGAGGLPPAPAVARPGPDLQPLDAGAVGSDVVHTDRLVTGSAAGAAWANVDLASCVLDGVVLAAAELTACSWVDTSLRLADLHGLTADRLRAARVDLAGCRLTGVTLTAAELTDVDAGQLRAPDLAVRMSRLRRVRFTGCVLTGLDLTGSELTEVAFVDCDLSGADFDHARLRSVVFSGCELVAVTGVSGLRGSRIDEACLAGLGPSLAAGLGIEIEAAGGVG